MAAVPTNFIKTMAVDTDVIIALMATTHMTTVAVTIVILALLDPTAITKTGTHVMLATTVPQA